MCYCNVLLKEMIPKKNRLAKHNDYLFMQDGARTHTAKLESELLKDRKQETTSITGASSLATN